MDKILKFIRALPPDLRQRVRDVYLQIAQNQLDQLDIKPLSGKKNWFRCRVGKIRIVFVRTPSGNVIYEIQFRGQAYRSL